MLQFWSNVEIADREYPRTYSGRSAQIIGHVERTYSGRSAQIIDHVEMSAEEYPRDIRRGEQN